MAWLAEAAAAPDRCDVVLVDPPYADVASLVRVLEDVGAVVRPDGIVVAKHFWRDAPPARVGLLASERDRRFGETALTFYRRTAEPEQEAGET